MTGSAPGLVMLVAVSILRHEPRERKGLKTVFMLSGFPTVLLILEASLSLDVCVAGNKHAEGSPAPSLVSKGSDPLSYRDNLLSAT